MAGRSGSRVTASITRSLLWALWVALCLLGRAKADEREVVYDIDLRAQSLAGALNGLSEQTGVAVVFRYDLTRDRESQPVHGRYTPVQALDELLKGTGLSGGLSEKGVLTIRETESRTHPGETSVNQTDTKTIATRTVTIGRVGTFFASLAAVFSAHAQESAQAPVLEEVVVSAQKKGNERLRDVPIPVSVLTADTLTQNNRLLLTDYAASVPGLTVEPLKFNNTGLAIRGLTTGGFTLPTVAITIDGLPFGQGLQPPNIDPGDLERVEILRGPQGTLYGASSIGGLINYVTKDPTLDRFSSHIEAGTSFVDHGSDAGLNLRAAANIPVSETLALRLSGYANDQPGYIDNPVLGLKDVNALRSRGGQAIALFQPSGVFSLKLSALYNRLKTDGSSDVNVPTAGFPQTQGLHDLEQNYVPGIGGQKTTVEAYSAVIKAKLGSVDLTSLSGYNVYDSPSSFDWSSTFGPSVRSDWGVTGAPFFDLSRYRKLVQELRLSSSIGTDVDWQLAGFYSHTRLRGYEYLLAADATTGEQLGKHWTLMYPRTYREAALFANVTYRLTERFDIQFGGRQGRNEEEQEAFVQEGPYIEDTSGVPRIAAPPVRSKSNTFTYLVTPRFKLSPEVMAYARFASGYRPGGPNSSDPSIPASYGADKTQNYELGVKGDFFDRAVSLDASLYHIDWKNIQIQRFSATNLSYTSNGSGAKSEGLELAGTWHPAKGTTFSGWYAYNKAELTEAFPVPGPLYGAPGDRLPLSSRNSGSLSVDQDLTLGGTLAVFAGATANFVGDRVGVFQGFATNADPLPRQKLPSYTQVDLRAGMRYPSWTASLYVRNVSDERGVINGGLGDILPFSFQYIQPRTYGITVTKDFE